MNKTYAGLGSKEISDNAEAIIMKEIKRKNVVFFYVVEAPSNCEGLRHISFRGHELLNHCLI